MGSSQLEETARKCVQTRVMPASWVLDSLDNELSKNVTQNGQRHGMSAEVICVLISNAIAAILLVIDQLS